MSQWAHYGEPNPDTAVIRSVLAQIGPNGIDGTVLERRPKVNFLIATGLQHANYPKTGLSVVDKKIPVGKDGEEITIRIYTPDSIDENETFPVIIDFHGGAFCTGTLNDDEIQLREFTISHRVVCVNVDFRLAPEHPYPIPIEDCLEATRWVAKNAKDIRVDPLKGFILSGFSSGALTAEIIAQEGRYDSVLKGVITGHHLFCPIAFSTAQGVFPEKYADQLLSYRAVEDKLALNVDEFHVFMDAYKPGPMEDPRSSPALAKSLKGIPPAFFQVNGLDPLRDEGMLYAKLLEEAGVKVRVDVYPGILHGTNSFVPTLESSKKWRKDLDDGMKWLLSLAPKPTTNVMLSVYAFAYKQAERFLLKVLSAGPVPRHVAFVMDGNRRYARRKHMDVKSGHSDGFLALRRLLEVCLDLKIHCVSVYAFSIENFKRPPDEVEALMRLARTKLYELCEKGNLLDEYGVRLNVIGHTSLLPPDVLEAVEKAESQTRHNNKAILNLCMPYTSRDEISEAIGKTIMDCLDGSADPNEITADTIEANLMTSRVGSPPLDVLVRTSGVRRLSDYMLWQSCDNVQIQFVDKYWPEFGLLDFVPIILAYQRKVWSKWWREDKKMVEGDTGHLYEKLSHEDSIGSIYAN